MKILFVSRGNFIHTLTYVDFFLKMGHKIYYYALCPVPEVVYQKYSPKITIINVLKHEISTRYTLKKLVLLKSYLYLNTFIKRIKPEIVHLHFLTSGGFSSLFFNHPCIFLTIHGSDILVRKEWYWRIVQRKVLSKVHNVIVVSKQIENQVLNFGIDSKKITYLPVGIDTKLFNTKEKYTKDLSALKVISTRSLEKIYNYETIIKALALLFKIGVPFHLTIVGKGMEEGRLKELTKLYCISEYVTFIGHKSSDEIVKLFEDHWVYVSASHSDGTSLSLLEAMISGLYPVVSEITANEYWIKNGEGLMFSSKSPEELFSKLVFLWEKRESLLLNVIRNQDLVKREGDLYRNMNILLQLYSNCLEKTQKI